MEQSTKKHNAEQKPDSDATSQETLKDVEGSEKVTSDGSKSDTGPSPDGALDEQREQDKGGPM